MNAAHNLARSLVQTILSEKPRNEVTTKAIEQAIDQVALIVGAVDRDVLVRELEAMFSVWVGSSTVLESSEGHKPWLPDVKSTTTWGYWLRYQQYLQKVQQWAPASLTELDRTTDDVLSQLENPKRDGPWDRRGLVVGHVQSGKTSNYTGVICKAADAGYKVVIVLTGIHNSLRSQTQLRLDAGFLGFDSKATAKSNKGALTGVGLLDSSLRPVPLTTSEEVGDFRRDFARRVLLQPGEQPILLVLKKNGSVLQNVLNWILDTLQPAQDGDRNVVKKWPVLVIDDEADNASVDTRDQGYDEHGDPDPDHDPTRINRLIRRILHSFDRAAYVGYTATPFANIYIHEKAWTKECGRDLFPRSFIVNLTAPSNYVGPVRVFGLQKTDADEGAAPLGVARHIVDFVDKSDDLSVGWMPNGHKKDHVPLFKGAKEVPPSLREAMHAFVLSCAGRRARGQVQVHNSMLIHVTRFTDVQRAVYEQVESELKQIVQRLQYGDGEAPEPLRATLKALWENDFVPTSSAMKDEKLQPLTWEQVDAQLLDASKVIKLKLINGKAEDILDYDEHQEGISVIAVGGDKLARGLTLEGLTVSYYLRATVMYDTLMQMGRWFGYRPGYVDLCRLYLTDELEDWFEHVTLASEELRVEFDRMASIGETPEAYGLRVRSHPALLITSQVKMRKGVDLSLSFAGDIVETTILETGERNRRNVERTARFLASIPDQPTVDPWQSRSGRKSEWKSSLQWNHVKAALVTDYLASLHTPSGAYKANGRLLSDYINQQQQHDELTDWTVVLLSNRDAFSDEPVEPPAHKFKIGGHEIGAFTRSPLLPKPPQTGLVDAYRVRRLVSPRDEAIDIDEAAWASALKKTKAQLKPDQGRGLTPQDVAEVKIPNGPNLRACRSSSKGLLLLYPLDPPSKKGLSKVLQDSIDADVPIMGFAVSFPGSKSGAFVEYRVNSVYAETLR